MYYLTEMQVSVRVPPNRFGEQIEKVIIDLAREKYENSVDPETGLIVAVNSVVSLSPGKIVPGDGATYHDVVFNAVTYKPLKGEMIQGEVAETIKFGVFLRLGCTDALSHMSQIGQEKFALSTRKGGVLIGRDTGRQLRVGDSVRAKIINASIDHVSMKIAVTMKNKRLGTLAWRKAIIEEEKRRKEEEKRRKEERKKKERGR
ncbi:MAG: DNA-directed RNA polymerase [Candidatus Hodarchaeales archaeon]